MRALPLLLALALPALADEPQPDPVTRHLPADAFVVLRVAPPERLDAIGHDLPALAELMGERRPLGDVYLQGMPARTLVDRSKPIYVAIGSAGTTILVRAMPGTTAEQVAALGGGNRLLADGWIGTPTGVEVAEQTEPLSLLPGDVSVVVPVAKLVTKYGAKLKDGMKLRNLDELAANLPVPPGTVKLVRALAARAVDAVSDITDIHYALTWHDGRLESEGSIRTREGSAFRRWLLGRAGGKPNGLIGLFPERAFWMVESGGTTAALDGDVAAFLDGTLGEGAGDALLLFLSPSYALHDQLTGQSAGVILVQGMMAMSMESVHEGKPDARIAEAIAGIDVEKTNRILAGLKIPLEAKLERDFAKDGDTALHRLTFASSEPQLAMFCLQMRTCFAVEGHHLLVVQSGSPENELRALLSRVRSDERKEHPHSKAMERLMPDRAEGLSINIGTLKPVLGMIAMAVPQAAKVVNAFPDDLWLSTALSVQGGNIRIRGDWPLKECLDFAATMKKTLR